MSTILFTLYAAMLAFVSLRPVDGASIEPWDKLFHFIFYAIFAILGARIVATRRAYWMVCAGIVFYSLLLEIAQSFIPGRVMSPLDLVANTAGVALAAALAANRLRADADG